MPQSNSSKKLFGHFITTQTVENCVTDYVGLPYFISRSRMSETARDVARILEEHAPRSERCLYTSSDLVLQTFAALVVGSPDLSDTKSLSKHQAFRLCLSNPECASSSTLCRFFQNFDATCKEERYQRLCAKRIRLFSLAKADPLRISSPVLQKLHDYSIGQAINIVKRFYPEGPIIVDVDSTPVKSDCGGDTAYDGGYGATGYLPLLCVINGVPAFVQNAPGATNGAKLLMIHLHALLQRLKKAFPNRLILLRADTGFSTNEIIEAVESESCKYLIGCNHNQTLIRQALYLHICERMEVAPDLPFQIPDRIAAALRLDNLFIKHLEPVSRENWTTTTIGGKFRCTGFIPGYRAKSWQTQRTVCYRFDFNPAQEGDEVDIRFIQTNLTNEEVIELSKDRGKEKDRSRPYETFEIPLTMDAEASVELYESLFCDRGQDERVNREWKADCCASRCSLGGFFANSLHMVLSLICFQRFEEIRLEIVQNERMLKRERKERAKGKPNISRSHCAVPRCCGPSIDSIRKFLINLPGKFKKVSRRITYSILPMSPEWAYRFEILKS